MNTLLVGRLLRYYDPFTRLLFAHSPPLALVRSAPLVDGVVAHAPADARDDSWGVWDLGRIRYFVELLEDGVEVDPISLDWRWHGLSPVALDLLDGHHRLCAAALLRKRRLGVSYGGPLDFMEYLAGVRRTVPRGYF